MLASATQHITMESLRDQLMYLFSYSFYPNYGVASLSWKIVQDIAQGVKNPSKNEI